MGISVGFMGLGRFARYFTPLFPHHPRVDRIALCDLEAERGREYVKAFGGKRTKPSAKDCFGSIAALPGAYGHKTVGN